MHSNRTKKQTHISDKWLKNTV